MQELRSAMGGCRETRVEGPVTCMDVHMGMDGTWVLLVHMC